MPAIRGVTDFPPYREVICPENMMALRVHPERSRSVPTIKEGKAINLEKILYPRYPGRPIFAAGDSKGDFWMLKALGTDGILVVVGGNRSLTDAPEAEHIPYYRLCEPENQTP